MVSLIGPLVVVGLVLALVLIWVSLTLARSQEGRQSGWGLWTRYFLVLLRLSIGWHFLIEGVEKLNSSNWSSEGYLQEATGPLAPQFRELAGERLFSQLTRGQDGRLPEDLRSAWESYFDHFSDHYQLTEEQKTKADTVFRQSESKTLTWMTSESKPIAKPQPQGPPLMVAMTIPERLEYLQKLEDRLEELESAYRPTFGKDTFAKMKEAKADAKRVRSELKSDLAGQTAALKSALQSVLTPKQKEMAPPAAPALPIARWSRLDWADAIVKYGLLAVGAGLLVGLLTRLACVGGAALLLMFFLAMPPLPGWPESPRVEGHYLYINKNIIEMLALLALATTRSGRWVGLDGLLQFLSPALAKPAPGAV